MLKKKPLFAARGGFAQQLSLIFSLLGAPTPREITALGVDEARASECRRPRGGRAEESAAERGGRRRAARVGRRARAARGGR